jgi:hypothetical protein
LIFTEYHSQVLAFLLCIWNVLGSNFSPETSCPEIFCGFPQSVQKKF